MTKGATMEFKKTESTVKPKVVELAGDMAYIRKNIQKIERESNGSIIEMFSYEEAYCNKNDAINYLAELNEENNNRSDGLAKAINILCELMEDE